MRAPKPKKKRVSPLEERLNLHLRAAKVPAYEREYRFAAHHVGLGDGIKARLKEAGLKDWRFDFAWPELRLAVEAEGGGWSGGRHTRGKGFAQDMRKYEAAMRLGWNVYRCDGAMIRKGQALKTIELLIEQGGK